MNKISATIVADSVNKQGDRLTSLLITFPRILLSEINTHRMLSKNTSSSRAIPFEKMVESVQNNPFIPITWQKQHSGMQGKDYLDETIKYDLISFIDILNDTLTNEKDEQKKKVLKKRIEEKTKIIKELLTPYALLEKTLPEWWLFARDKAVEAASILYVFDVTKQLCNRLLEPFMWTTMLITGSKEGWQNFFNLRCPVYYYAGNGKSYKSKKELLPILLNDFGKAPVDSFWYNINKGQAEIHMMALAEAIYDAVNESTPQQLQAGEWHIPFEDKIIENAYNTGLLDIHNEYTLTKVKISTAMAAHTSYTIVGGEAVKSYEKWIELHDKLIAYNPPHSSPMEHCARAMSDKEYRQFIKGKCDVTSDCYIYEDDSIDCNYDVKKESLGWCNNLKGFIPYRYMIDNKINIE